MIHLARASSQLSPARVPLVTAAACARVFVCTSETLGAFRFCTYGLYATLPRTPPPPPAQQPAGTRHAVTRPQPPPVGLVPSLHYPFSYHHPTSPWNARRDCRHRHFCAAADGRSPRQRPRRLSNILENTHRAARRSHERSQHRPRARGFAKIILRAITRRGGEEVGGGAPDRLPSRTATDEMTALLVRQPAPPPPREARLPFGVRGHHGVYNIIYT